jgi:hypothetical protein
MTTITENVLSLKMRDHFVNQDGMTLIVNYRLWPQGTSDDDVIENRVPSILTELTSDGRFAVTNEYHQGDEANWVYVERWENQDGNTVRTFHGWIDSVSRCLLQAG